MSRLERRCRLLLRAYPAAYRRERGEEILGTLLEATPAGRASPLPRDARALIMGGLRARAAQGRRLTTAASLRQVLLLGVAISLSFTAGWEPSDGQGWLPPPAGPLVAVAMLLIAVTVLLAWFARRVVVAAAALAAGTAAVFAGFSLTFTRIPTVCIVLYLAALVVLAGGAERPPRSWLWLPGLVMAVPVLAQLSWVNWPTGWEFLLVNQAYLVLIMAVAALRWTGIDARPAAGLAICLALIGLSELVNSVAPIGQSGITSAMDLAWYLVPFMPASAAGAAALLVAESMWLVCAIVLATPALWRLRWQTML